MRSMGRPALERINAALAALGNTPCSSLDDLVQAVERRRATTITIAEVDIDPDDGLTGLWISRADGDFILHAPTVSELHRRQIVLHELAHMILDHDLAQGPGALAALFPDLSEGAVLRVLARGHEDNEMEREAEAVADLLARMLRRGAQRSPFDEIFG